MNEIFVECPHCGGGILVIAINCAIFRHGVFKGVTRQLPPHETKSECDSLSQQGVIWGCGRPFRLEKGDSVYTAVKCEYI